MKHFAIAYIIVLGVMSLIAFVTYGIDKRRARADKRRVPEKTLHLIAFLGGWPGALVGQRVFRHKTHKLSFRILFWLVVALHCVLVVGVVYWIRQLG